MTDSTLALGEADRLARLKKLGLLSDTADLVLDGFVRLAANMTEMPMAAITSMDAGAAHTKSTFGFTAGPAIERGRSFCNHAMQVEGVFEVADARLDPRFLHFPAVATAERMGLAHFAGVALRMPGGECVAMLCVASDQPGKLGDRKRKLLADLAAQIVEVLLLRESEQLLTREKLVSEAIQLSELAPVGMFSADADGQVLHGNTHWARMLDVTRYDELLGETWLRAVHPDFRSDVETSWRKAVAERKPFTIRFKTASEADPRWIRMQFAPVDSGVASMSFIGATLDATKTVELSEEIRAKNDLLEAIIKNLPCGLTVIDSNGRCVVTNPVARHLLDLPDDLFWNDETSFSDVAGFLARRGEYGPGDPDELVQARLQSLLSQSTYAYERAGVNGKVLEVHGRRTPEGLIVSSYADVTEARQAAAELRAARDAANAASHAKTDFLATMSHEIRTPLNGVIGLTQTLSRGALPATESDVVAMIDSCAKSLLSLVDNILDFSKIESGKLMLEEVPTDLFQLLREVGDVFRGRAMEKGLRFRLHVAPDVPLWVSADPGRLRQVLLNLLANALKFTSQGGFELRVSREPGGRVAFAVSDTGIGIPEQDQQRLFTRFTQVDASATRRFQGSGLGLAISRQLANLMGGDIALQSEAGTGSTFTMTVPLDATAAPAQMPSGVVRAFHAGARILLAEDNPINQLVAKRILATLGYENVQVVADGKQAVDACEAADFDLVLMDCQMPIMSGQEATQRLRALGVHTPVIAFTASATAGDRDDCLAAGMNDYIAKPIEVSVLATKLNRWLAGGSEPVALAPEPHVAEFDKTVLNDYFLGDHELFQQARHVFIDNATTQIMELTAAIALQDNAAVRRVAHKLRGGAGQMGARLLAERCGKLEQFAGQEGRPLGRLLSEAREAFDGFVAQTDSVLA